MSTSHANGTLLFCFARKRAEECYNRTKSNATKEELVIEEDDAIHNGLQHGLAELYAPDEEDDLTEADIYRDLAP